MAKNLKLKIKNAQLAGALKITKVKSTKKITAKKATVKEEPKKPKVRILISPEEVEVKKEIEPIQPNLDLDLAQKREEQLFKDIQALPVEEPLNEQAPLEEIPTEEVPTEKIPQEPYVKLGVLQKRPEKAPSKLPKKEEKKATEQKEESEDEKPTSTKDKTGVDIGKKKEAKTSFKDFKDFKSTRKKETTKSFDSRDKQGLRASDEEGWRKKRRFKGKKPAMPEELIVRPKSLTVHIPISVKALAQEMKRKASEVITKLFMQGITMTLNDIIDDETVVQLIGQELDCDIAIDTTEEKLLKISEETIQDEVNKSDPKDLSHRPVILTFMGHVDHGKTSLIDAIRKTKVTEQEAGAITQHIGAFKVKTENSEVTILDTPGHEAFTQMRHRGAGVTDIVILVIAGDEGIKDQTIEAIEQAKNSNAPILVAINKCDKENFDVDKVYRQLADLELLPETWGGSTITVNCSAITKEGIAELLEMAALQAEILELRANNQMRARGTILESEMHKGFGAIATCLVQNGTLKLNDAIVFGTEWGRVKTMHDELNRPLKSALPSTPVKITGLSGLAEAGCEFIVVSSEKEARKTADARRVGEKRENLLLRKKGLDHLMTEQAAKKIFPILLKADVQGSLEALKNSLLKIKSEKIELNIISESIGEISESDVELAAASSALILGFHTRIEAHAEPLIKELKADVILHDIIYHAVDEVREKMTNLLDKLPEEHDKGSAEIKLVYKSSHLGLIAGCQVIDGTISRNHYARLIRNNKEIWKGKIASVKRDKDDVKEVQKGMECGILLLKNKDIQEGDIIQAFEIIYIKQSL